MADNAKNCPFSATAGSTDYAMTCAELRALNSNAGCPFYDSDDDTCVLANFARRYKQISGKKD